MNRDKVRVRLLVLFNIAFHLGHRDYNEITDYRNTKIDEALREILNEIMGEEEEISLCPHCYCMTKNICGKCKKVKARGEE